MNRNSQLAIRRVVQFLTGVVLISSGQGVLAQGVPPKASPPPEALQQYQMFKDLIRQAKKDRNERKQDIEKLNQTLDQLQAERDAAIAKQDKIGISNASFDDVMRTLQTQRVELAIEWAGLQARADLLFDRLKKAENQKTKADEQVLSPLRALLKKQREQLSVLQKLTEQRQVSRSELAKAEMQILETEIQISSIEKGQPDRGPGRLGEQLTEVTLAQAENRARLQKVVELLGKYAASVRNEVAQVLEMQAEIKRQKKVHLSISNLLKATANREAEIRKSIIELQSRYEFGDR